MDLGTLITACILLAVCTLPFVLMNRKKQKRVKELFTNFSEMIQSKGLQLGQYDVCGDIVIGMDANSSRLFYYKKHKETASNMEIEINSIANCNVSKIYSDGSNVSNDNTSIDKITLLFALKSSSVKEKSIVLFDDDDNLQLDGELQLAEKWSKLIQTSIK